MQVFSGAVGLRSLIVRNVICLTLKCFGSYVFYGLLTILLYGVVPSFTMPISTMDLFLICM